MTLSFAVMSLSSVVVVAKLVPFYHRWKLDLSSFDCQEPFQRSAGQLKTDNFNYHEHLTFISDRCQQFYRVMALVN